MNRLTRLAALRAAAKVALSVSVFGCSTSVDSAPQDDKQAEAATSSSSGGDGGQGPQHHQPQGTGGAGGADVGQGGAGGSGGSDVALTCDTSGLGGSGGGGDVSHEAFLCCVDYLMPFAPKEGGAFDKAAAANDGVDACCNAVIARIDNHLQEYGKAPWNEVGACCQLEGTPTGAACTPWGPPMPPAMIDLDTLLEVA